jgi:acyl-CoA thioesterase-2
MKGKSVFFSSLDVPRPEDLLSVDQYLQEVLHDRRLTPETRRIAEQELVIPIGLDIRYCQRRDLIEPKAQWPARFLAWVKTIDPLPNDPQIHQSVIAYASDRILLISAYHPYELMGFDCRVKLQTSLDHAIWFHDGFDWKRSEKDEEKSKKTSIPRSSSIPTRPKDSPVRADQWLLFEIDCSMQMNNRAFALGRVWTQDRRLIATCTQEGVIRMR